MGELGGEAPLSLTIPGADGREQPLVFLQVLRELPGKRIACRARWREETVFAKIFCDKKRARVHWQREAQGIAALVGKGILTPRPIYSGPAGSRGNFVAAYEYIEGGQSFASVWAESDETERLRRLKALVGLLGQHHRAGIVQRDLHLDNFLVAGERIYTLDGDGISARSRPLRKSAALENLAWLFAQLLPLYDSWVDEVLPAYGEGAAVDIADAARLRGLIRRKRIQRRRHFLKKTLRQCSAFSCRRSWREFRVFDRSFAGEGLERLLSDPDAVMAAGTFLKQGNTSTVSRVSVEGREWVVKRYNIKHWRHALGRFWRPSRASVSWCNAHRLRFYGIATPGPVALLEKRWGPFRGRAYFVSEYREGEDALGYFLDDGVSPDCKAATAGRIAGVLMALKHLRISHGDMKATNIRISGEAVMLMDLDSMREHAWAWIYARAWLRDRGRFLENWREAPAVRELFARLLDAGPDHGEGAVDA